MTKNEKAKFNVGDLIDPLKPLKDFHEAACGKEPVVTLGNEKLYICNNLRNLWEPNDKFSFWKSYGVLIVILPILLWDLFVDPFLWLIAMIPIIGPIISSLWLVVILDLIALVSMWYWKGPIAIIGALEFMAVFQLIPIVGMFIGLIALFPWWNVVNVVWFFFYRRSD